MEYLLKVFFFLGCEPMRYWIDWDHTKWTWINKHSCLIKCDDCKTDHKSCFLMNILDYLCHYLIVKFYQTDTVGIQLYINGTWEMGFCGCNFRHNFPPPHDLNPINEPKLYRFRSQTDLKLPFSALTWSKCLTWIWENDKTTCDQRS